MTSFRNISIRKKILVSMLAFTLLPIVLVASVATAITYKTMRDQLIYNHRMSSGWLQDRVELENVALMNRFYEFEVDKEIKADILRWCTQGEALNYASQRRFITLMNTVISMDSNLNSIALFNLAEDRVLIAERSGARLADTDDMLAMWEKRDPALQSNMVFLRTEREILVMHQIHRFDNKTPIALVVFHLRPYFLQDILEEIKTVPEETILIFNDQHELIEADYGTGWSMDADIVEGIRQELATGERKEASYADQFWFYRAVNGGKMQILLTVPNQTIVDALFPTVLSSILVALIAILASIVCSIVYSRAISSPIRRLSEEMKTLTINEFSGSFAENREDEIGILQDSFDRMIARNKELIAQEYQSKLEKRSAQLRALQAQINPHFMYNTLQVIGGMALKKNAPSIYQITVALSDIMRYSLNFSKEMVCLEEELLYLESYAMIQRERFGGKVQLNLEIAPETRDCLIPKLILQPLVENCFEHGLLDKAGPWIITVESRLDGDRDLLLWVKDNGTGFAPERLAQVRDQIDKDTMNALKSGSHIGLANVHARIRLRSGGADYGVTIYSTPQEGPAVCVRLQAVFKGGGKE